MNEELHTHIEPELEARITALVLGEASEFEADELERTIAEAPELALFRRRVLAMHDLLDEAVNQKPNEAWRLSDDRRAALLRTFTQKENPITKPRSRHPRGGNYRAAIVIAACLLVCLVLFSMTTPVVMRQSRKAIPEIAASSAAEETDSILPPADEIVWAPQASPKSKTLPTTGKLFKNGKGKDTGVTYPGIVSKRAVTSHIARKPAAPTSSMAMVKVGNLSQVSVIPVPETEASEPIIDFGAGDDFGKGWGGSGGGESDPFAAPVGGSIAKVERSGNQSKQGRVIGRELSRVSGISAKKGRSTSNTATAGLRSGDFATTRNSIDAILNNPNRTKGKKRRVGKYQEARQILEGVLQEAPTNFAAKKQLEDLDAPIRTNAAGTAAHTQNVDQVRKDLYMGEGYYNLGQYDKADAHFKKVLRTDKYNKAARRWMEKVAATQSDYYRASYDHTRAELLKEVDAAWEMPAPPELNRPLLAAPPVSGKPSKLATIQRDLKNKNDRVAEKRKKLMALAERVGLIYVETEQGGKTTGNTIDLREQAEKELYKTEREREEIAVQMKKFLSVNDEDFISVVSELPDVKFKEAYQKYEKAKTELQTMKASGLGKTHPDIKMRQTRIAELKKSLEKRATNVRKSMKHRLTLLNGRVEKMKEITTQLQDQDTPKARAIQEFNLARKEYQTALAIKNQMEARYNLEKTKATSSGEKAAIIPSPTRPKALPDETTTTTQPFSTFSLNVADVSFKLAKVALLEKGEWPTAAKVRTEEFVNAFDYGDPSPRRGERVACAIEQSAHPFLQQRNLLRIGMKTASIGRSAPLRLTVLLDNSGSMEREDREASVLAAIRVLAAQLGPQDVITLVGFARQPRLLADRISGDKADQLVRIVANTPSEGGTNLEEALRLARTLALRQHTDGAQDRIVLITDGVANLGNTVPEELAREIETMRQKGISFDACGIGAEGLNDEILEALTRKGDGRYYFLNRPEDADSGFAKQLAGALTPAAKNVKIQVKFNSQRVTKYRLLGFEKHRLKKQDFRNDKVDAAEMAAEEAGNAVYQIQVNPNGTGELGEVFVRFLDVRTGRMVERSWPLPYQPQAKPFDLATPSMQLAGTAAMLGEKLHGTDAGSVRFPQVSNTLHKLRAHYSADPKVQDLIRMCEKVK